MLRKLLEAGRLRDGRGDAVRVGDRREFDKPYAVAKSRGDLGGRCDRRARLPHAARARQGHEAALQQRGVDLLDLALASDDATEWQRQVGTGRLAAEAIAQDKGDEFGPRSDVELCEQRRHVRLDGALAQPEAFGDVAVREPGRNQL
jgi:hypothetical protein